MIPGGKICTLRRAQRRARGAVISDGRVPHACLLELFTDAGPGTIIRR